MLDEWSIAVLENAKEVRAMGVTHILCYRGYTVDFIGVPEDWNLPLYDNDEFTLNGA